MKDMKINNLKNHKFFIKSLLLTVVSLAFISCSNLFGDNLPENPSTERPETITITGQITISEELAASGAVPEEYRSFFASLTKSDERSAFPTAPADGEYIITATAEEKTAESINITTEDDVTSYSIILPIDETNTSWTITAEYKASFNGCTEKILILTDTFTDTFSYNKPSFTHNFQLKPLASGNGNIELEITYETSGTADELELYLGETKINADAEAGEEISPSAITLKNITAGTYNAKLVFKKSGYVVFTDYQGITVFPNMTTNKWINSVFNSSSPSPITSTNTYKVTDDLVSAYKLTQIFVGTITVAGVEITGRDDTGNGTVFAPYATLSKAINYLITSGNTGTPYTIWIGGEVTGSTTIQDGTSPAASVKAESLTLSGFNNDNTKDKLKAGSSGSVLLVDTSVPVTITNLTITGGMGTSTVIYNTTSKLCGGGLNVKSGSVTLTTGTQITGNSAAFGGGVYVASGAKLFMSGNSVVGEPITNDTTTASAENYTTFANCANYATEYGGGIYVNGGELYIGYSNASTVDVDFTGGVNRNLCPTNTIPQDGWGGGIYYKGPCFKMAKGTVAYNYAKMSGGGITVYDANTVFDFSGGSIEKNTAGNEGGGLYLNSAKVYMNGTAIIGDTDTSMSQTSDFSNKATGTDASGGGFYMEGGSSELYLGYTVPVTEDGDPVADNSFTGGICHNYSAKSAGGLYHYGGLVKINKCNLSYNKAESNGGGGYIYGNFTMNGGDFTSNTCGENGSGGALYCVCSYGTYNMTGGTFTTNTCGTNGNGGAIYYSYGTFNYSGSLSFPSGSLRNNDIYIANSKKITIAGNSLSGSASITPSVWTRGTQIIDGGTNVTDTTLSQFSITDSDWSIEKSGSNSSAKGIINADIYVSASGNDSYTGASSSKAFKTISAAAKSCRSCKTEIKVVGTFSASSASDLQSIPNSDDISVSSITLTGTGSGATINANSKGSAFTINKAILVNIENITLKGGNTSSNGAGLNVAVSGAKVNLGNNVVIRENKATYNGGGVYVASGAILCLNGSSIIGNSGGNRPANTSVEPNSSNGINKANYGGGIYCSGTLGIGKSVNSSGTLSNSSFSGGIYTNLSVSHGGGIYLTNTSTLSTNGSYIISKNRAGDFGAGIYYASTNALSLSSATFTNNEARGGGAIIIPIGNNIDITVSGGTYTSNSATNGAGGAIHSESTGLLKLEGSVSFTSNTGYDVYGGGAFSHMGSIVFNSTNISIPYGGSKGSNGVWVASGKYIELKQVLSNHNSTNQIGINGTVDNQVLGGSKLNANIEKFKIADDGYYIDTSGYMRQVITETYVLDSITSQSQIETYESQMQSNGSTRLGAIDLNDFENKLIYFILYTRDDDLDDDVPPIPAYGVITFTKVDYMNACIDYEFKRFKNNSLEIDAKGTIYLDDYENFPSTELFLGLNEDYLTAGSEEIAFDNNNDQPAGDLRIDKDENSDSYLLYISIDGTDGEVGYYSPDLH